MTTRRPHDCPGVGKSGSSIGRRAGPPLGRWLATVGFALCLGAGVAPAAAPADSESAAAERSIKAAFLYKFAGYVQWPEGALARADAPINIAVLGEDRLADELIPLVAGRTVDGHPLTVRKQKDDEVPSGIHILFIGRAETARLRSIAAQARPILIVTESEGALAQGSAINFVVTGGRVRFEISLDAAEKRRLKLSSRLLSVAQNVYAEPPERP